MAKDWLTQFMDTPMLGRMQKALLSSVDKPIWWQVSEALPKSLKYTTKVTRRCRYVRESSKNQKACQDLLVKQIHIATDKNEVQHFKCPYEKHAAVIPVHLPGHHTGAVAVCHSEESIAEPITEMAALTLKAVAREQEQQRELKELADTLQPRCVALSTIHTVHRLISSTLDLDELLPRMARLTSQVLRAEQCSIWLADLKAKQLISRAVVESGAKTVRVGKPIKIGSGIVGSVAKDAKVYLKNQRMIVPLFEEECIGVIEVKRGRSGKPFSSLDQEILTTLSEQAVVAIRNAQSYEAQERITWGSIQSLSAMLDGMAPYDAAGTSRPEVLVQVSLGIAEEMGLSRSEKRAIEYAARLHNASRIGIPSEILAKETELEPSEYDKIKEHTVRGVRVLGYLDTLEPAIPIMMYHHERYDGAGYPKGLKGDQIPMGARILGVANTFEAMTCDRPYRKAVSVKKATEEIASHAGTQFDPKVVDAFKAWVGIQDPKALDALVAIKVKSRRR